MEERGILNIRVSPLEEDLEKELELLKD